MPESVLAELPERILAAARHRLTVSDFRRMAEAGVLGEDDRVELIEGELFDMAPIGSRHASIVDFLAERFTLGAGGRVLVRVQGPLEVSPNNEPAPDLLLLKPRPDRYRDALPQASDALLVVEVADSSLARDRDVKIPLYARHAIPEAWLVDVQSRCLTVFRDPRPAGYRRAMEFASGTVAPQCLPDVSIDVADLLGGPGVGKAQPV
ncbi:MAG: Uma2 family endonuclease [Betaproteobacteria bacterium]|nr:Uma2 family endonuclease [Betaproteobacteria bacterium]